MKLEAREEITRALREDVFSGHNKVAGAAEDPRVVADLCFRWWTAATCPTFFMFQDLRSAASERNLMFDPDVHSLLEVLPSRIRNGANFGAQLVRRLDRPASRVPNSNSMLPLCWPPQAHRLSRKCKPILGKVRRLIMGRNHRTTGAWPEKAELYANDTLWSEYIEKVINGDRTFAGEWLDRKRIAECWSSFKRGDREVAEDIERLIQLALLNH